MVLESSERLAILLAKSLDGNETRAPIIRNNIGSHQNLATTIKCVNGVIILVISVEQRNASDNNDVIFPAQELLNKAADNLASKTSASIQIPASLIQSRGLSAY